MRFTRSLELAAGGYVVFLADSVDFLFPGGFVETLPNGFIRVTDKGWPVLDAVVADLAA